jgi:hypothetical protein
MEDIIRRAVDLGIDGVDMTGYWFKSTDSANLASFDIWHSNRVYVFPARPLEPAQCKPKPASGLKSWRKSRSGWM